MFSFYFKDAEDDLFSLLPFANVWYFSTFRPHQENQQLQPRPYVGTSFKTLQFSAGANTAFLFARLKTDAEGGFTRLRLCRRNRKQNMNKLRYQIQNGANIGHRFREHDENVEATRQVLEEARRVAEHKVLTSAANEILKSAPTQMQGSARRSEAFSLVHWIPENEIDFPDNYFDGQPLDPSTLRGVSRRVFEILQEEGLNPVIEIPRRRTFKIKIPVLPNTELPPWSSLFRD